MRLLNNLKKDFIIAIISIGRRDLKIRGRGVFFNESNYKRELRGILYLLSWVS